ncbi:MAG: TraG family conjugative transposon ATPase [Bacteroidota bacterium]
MKSLSEILPLYSIEQDAILSKMGDITVGFRLELPEIFTLSCEQYDAFHQAWVRAMKILPAGTVFCKQDWFTQRKYKGDFGKERSFLSHSSERFFCERPYLEHECYVFLTRKPKNRTVADSLLSTLLRKHIVPVETLDAAFLTELNNAVGQFAKILSDSGFVKLQRLDNGSLKNCVSQYLNLGNDFIQRDLSFEKGIDVGEKHCELFTFSDAMNLPEGCDAKRNYEKYGGDQRHFPTGFVSPLGQLLSCDHIYSQYILIEDATVVLKKQESRKLRLQSLSAYSRNNEVSRQATELFLQEAAGMGRAPVRAYCNVLAWTDDVEEISALRNQCAAAISSMDAVPHIETIGAPQIFWAGIPGNGADLPINETFTTFVNQVCCFLNLETNYRSSLSPVGIRLGDRLSGRPLHVDVSDEPMERGIITNRNKVIIGGSGSGKSFLTNHLNRSYHEAQSHIVVVDMGNSYRGLCELVKGYYFTYSEKEPIAFNPFYLTQGEKPDTEKKESIKTLLLALWKKDDESFVRSEYVALSNALQLYYEREVFFRCFNSFYEFLSEDFVEVLRSQQVKDKDFDVSNFLYVLRPYYIGGEFDYLLNATENLDLLGQSFIVFEIDNIKDHPILFPVVTIIIMELFIAKMRRLQGMRKIILIEEAWKAIAKAGMAEYIKYLYKTVRKYFGEAWVVTQEIDDILSSVIVKETIINNSDCKILMDMRKFRHRSQELQAMMGLTDHEMAQLFSVNQSNEPVRRYKEVFISLGGHGKVYRVEVSPEENWAYTTEEKEKMKVMNASEKHGGIEKGIRSLVLVMLLLFVSVGSRAQIPIIGTVISKAIKVIDLKIQRMQNEVLVLQNVQKEIENKLHVLKMREISDWTLKQKELYENYFKELGMVKQSIREISSIELLEKQKIKSLQQLNSKL